MPTQHGIPHEKQDSSDFSFSFFWPCTVCSVTLTNRRTQTTPVTTTENTVKCKRMMVFSNDGADRWNSEGGPWHLLPDHPCIHFTSHERRQAVIGRGAK